jgi:hypothetical protein
MRTLGLQIIIHHTHAPVHKQSHRLNAGVVQVVVVVVVGVCVCVGGGVGGILGGAARIPQYHSTLR